MVRTLLQAGADVNAKDFRSMTPLMLAVSSENQDVAVLRALLAAGADVNAKSTVGETVLDWAKKFGDPAVIGALEKAGAKVGVPFAPPPRSQSPASRDAASRVEASIALLQRTSTPYAPWTTIEANDKWHARVKVLQTVAEAVEKRFE